MKTRSPGPGVVELLSDSRLRELERRWHESGAAEDCRTYLRERLRTGLPPARLQVAALCGFDVPLGLVEPLVVPPNEAELHFKRTAATLRKWGAGLVKLGRQTHFDLVEVLRVRFPNRWNSAENLEFLVRIVDSIDRVAAIQAVRIALQELVLSDWAREVPAAIRPLRELCDAVAGWSAGPAPDVSRPVREARQVLGRASGVSLLGALQRATKDPSDSAAALVRLAVGVRAQRIEAETGDDSFTVRMSVNTPFLQTLRDRLRDWSLANEAEHAWDVSESPAPDPVSEAWSRSEFARGEAENKVLVARVASGDLLLPMLEVAAVCGHVPALEALGRTPGRAFLATKEIAAIYRVTAGTVGGWTRGGCPVTKQGHRNRFDLPRVVAWLRRRESGGPREPLESFLRTIGHWDSDAKHRAQAALEEANLGGCAFDYAFGANAIDIRRRVHDAIRVAVVPWALGY